MAVSDAIPEDVMSDRPDDIPQDIWDTVAMTVATKEGVARAIMAERERAAGIADDVAAECREHAYSRTAKPQRIASSAQAFVVERIAKAIRGTE